MIELKIKNKKIKEIIKIRRNKNQNELKRSLSYSSILNNRYFVMRRLLYWIKTKNKKFSDFISIG